MTLIADIEATSKRDCLCTAAWLLRALMCPSSGPAKVTSFADRQKSTRQELRPSQTAMERLNGCRHLAAIAGHCLHIWSLKLLVADRIHVVLI